MTTKKTGKPRGRPRKQLPAKPRRGRGRPKVALRDHPEGLLRALALVYRGIGARKFAMLCALFSEFPEVDADADFKAKHPATDDYVPVGFDLSKIARGDPGKRPLERLKGRVDWLSGPRRGLTGYRLNEDDRRWLLHASTAILMNMLPTLSAQQKRNATALILERMGAATPTAKLRQSCGKLGRPI